jgi:hypothetical protein
VLLDSSFWLDVVAQDTQLPSLQYEAQARSRALA